MGTLLRCCTTILLLNASLPAICVPDQQGPDSLMKDSYVKSNVAVVSNAFGASDTSINNIVSVVERDTSYMQINTKLKAAAQRFKQKTIQAKNFVSQNDYNTEVCFLVDMSIPSGKKRFFVYNMKKDSVESSSLVSHGAGSYKQGCDDNLIFSNTPNSLMTSLGRYKIGVSYYGEWGLSYKLYGLDSTNSNAFSRAIVLHSDSYVPEKETFPRHIYESSGCPIVSPSILTMLGKYINGSKKPILLWIYN